MGNQENYNEIVDTEIVKVDFSEKPKKAKRESLLTRIIYTAITFFVGVAFIVMRNSIFDIFGYIVGAIAVIMGAVTIITFFAGKGKVWIMSLIWGIILCVCGIFCLCKPHVLADFSIYVFALIIFISGVVMIYFATRDKKEGVRAWTVILIFGIVLCIMGALMLLFVRQSQAVIAVMVGVSFLLTAVFNVVALFVK